MVLAESPSAGACFCQVLALFLLECTWTRPGVLAEIPRGLAARVAYGCRYPVLAPATATMVDRVAASKA